MRSLLLLVLLFGAAGTGTELMLLGHFEDWWQRVPLVGLAACALITCWVLGWPTATSLKALRMLGALFLPIGVLGLYLHFKGNVEFELELHASKSGLSLVWEALRGATPALAPGAMVQLGLLALLACYRHPGLLGAEKS